MAEPDRVSLSDILVQSGRKHAGDGRFVNPPIDIGSTLLFDTLAAFETARDVRYESGNVYYGRYGTPASFHLERAMCDLEGAYGCTVVSSGVAAITLSLMAMTKPGDHVLVADNVYGNTRGFCDVMLTRSGVEIEYYDPMIGPAIEGKFRPTTSVVMFEAPGSGTFECPDIRGIAAVAARNNVVTILDGTWATPIFCRPLALGVDVVVHSGSKYISGHSDGMIGLIICNEKTHMAIRKTVMTIGDKPGAQEVHLALRGLRTLELRMRRVQEAGFDRGFMASRSPEGRQGPPPCIRGLPRA